MKHYAAQEFWHSLSQLAPEIQQRAHKNFALLKENPYHPSLHFKKVGHFWSARVGRNHRALAVQRKDGSYLWLWIGSHDTYERMLSS